MSLGGGGPGGSGDSTGVAWVEFKPSPEIGHIGEAARVVGRESFVDETKTGFLGMMVRSMEVADLVKVGDGGRRERFGGSRRGGTDRWEAPAGWGTGPGRWGKGRGR